jgi:membrane protein implicated in regulation of membrane protease activity
MNPTRAGRGRRRRGATRAATAFRVYTRSVVVPIVGVLLAVFVLPPRWGSVLLVGVILWEVAEKVLWIRLIRRYPVAVGRETLIGQPVTVTATCRPEGRVRLGGESWQARCSTGAQAGETLVVEGVDRITLIVTR